MKIAWIYPINRRCGIALYSESYLKALSKDIEIDTFSSDDILINVNDSANRLNQYDLIHIQYETSFFMLKSHDYYSKLTKLINKPIVISLHEIYNNFPDVYPKDSITGILAPLKKIIYDLKHPTITTYEKHLKQEFNASKVLVHYKFQKEILNLKGISATNIEVLALPSEIPKNGIIDKDNSTSLQLVASGFINKNYNYRHLIKTLSSLSVPWNFTWLGGARTSEGGAIQAWLENEIVQRAWTKKFKVTGWLSEEDLKKSLTSADIALHFYNARSSSATLIRSFAHGIPVIATELPLTKELKEECSFIIVQNNKFKETAQIIDELYNNRNRLIEISDSECGYAANHNYDNQAKSLIDIYKKVII